MADAAAGRAVTRSRSARGRQRPPRTPPPPASRRAPSTRAPRPAALRPAARRRARDRRSRSSSACAARARPRGAARPRGWRRGRPRPRDTGVPGSARRSSGRPTGSASTSSSRAPWRSIRCSTSACESPVSSAVRAADARTAARPSAPTSGTRSVLEEGAPEPRTGASIQPRRRSLGSSRRRPPRPPSPGTSCTCRRPTVTRPGGRLQHGVVAAQRRRSPPPSVPREQRAQACVGAGHVPVAQRHAAASG